HPLGIPARRLILGLRSIPGLSPRYAINPTSRLHYENFTRGPLSAYLHLSGEQSMPDYLGVFETAGRKPARSDADLRAFMDQFHMDFPVVNDAGARQSAEALLRDIAAGRPFPLRGNIGGPLAPHIAAIAADLHLPADPAQMSPDQQQAVLDRLDDYVRVHD